MATLTGTTTSGESTFEKYVTRNPRFHEIQYQVEDKQTAILYVKSGTSYKEHSTLKAGTQFNIINKDFVLIDKIKHAEVKYGSVRGFIPIGKIRKPTRGNGTLYEDEVVDILNAEFLRIGRPIDIKIGNQTFKNLCYAVKVDTKLKRIYGSKGDPKADIIICEDIKNPFKGTPIYISHKKSGGPEAFQQYGGLSEKAGIEIYKHSEVQKFLKSASEYVINGRLTSPLMMMVNDVKLINMSIYGPQFGSKYSLNHTQIIGQGKPTLTMINDKTYTLSFSSHMSVSGDLSHFTGGYTPVFGATFRAGRGYTIDGRRIDGIRVGIYPKKLIETRGGIVTLK